MSARMKSAKLSGSLSMNTICHSDARPTARAVGRASLWQIVFMDREPESFADFIQADMASTRELDLLQMKNGLYVLPAVRRFVSAVHTDEDFEETVRALDAACRTMR